MIKLSDYSTKPPKDFDEDEYDDRLDEMVKEIGKLAETLYAVHDKNILVILQGMDASGKDGITENVFANCSPTNVRAYAFKKPSDEELSHDFLWRIHDHVPPKGHIHIFQRSHYEDVLIQRVHNWVDEDRIDARFEAINAFEKLLVKDNNTTILKFYLHISKERQLEKLEERKEVRRKNYKHNPGDYKERKLWDEYMKAYEDVLERSEIPWNIIPVDSRSYRNYLVARKVLETLKSFDLEWPELKDNNDD